MLVLDRVGKTYPNGVRALEGVSLDVAHGEILVVVGGSGCGNSTLLRAISGLDTPTQGRVALDAAAITAPHEKIGIISQEPRLLPWLDVPAMWASLETAESRAAIRVATRRNVG